MASHIETEMNSCLTEMEKLQEKIMNLQEQQRNLEKQTQEEKTIEVELNMAVMENWLDAYHFNEEQKKLAKVAMDDWKNLNRRGSEPYYVNTQENREESDLINKNYEKFFGNNSRNIMKPIESFQPKIGVKFLNMHHIRFTEPSQFMSDFIEAIHNLFQIQQKRIDELETVVAELNEKVK